MAEHTPIEPLPLSGLSQRLLGHSILCIGWTTFLWRRNTLGAKSPIPRKRPVEAAETSSAAPIPARGTRRRGRGRQAELQHSPSEPRAPRLNNRIARPRRPQSRAGRELTELPVLNPQQTLES